MDDDRTLINGCLIKDHAAWDAFIKKYSSLMYVSALSRLKKYGFTLDGHEIDEIRQNVLASIWRDDKLKLVKNAQSLPYWLAIVSGNAAMSYVKSKKRRERREAASLYDNIDEKELMELVPSAEADPRQAMIRGEMVEGIRKGFDSLPEKERLIVKLHVLHGKKYSEISDMLALPEGTVSSYIRRGKERLKKRLKEFLQFFAIIWKVAASLYIGGHSWPV